MIHKLLHTDEVIATKIRSVFQLSYTVEAKLLSATDFPPLKRPLINFINSPTDFFGYSKDGILAGVIEIEQNEDITSINSLVVHPQHFRQGIGRALISHVFSVFDSKCYVVETGLENEPAIRLYKEFGFMELKQWDTDHGVRKVKFRRNKCSNQSHSK